MTADILIIGAGPAGLIFARSLAGSGLRVTLVERQAEAALAEPADDGREIAITHHSHSLMHKLGLWQHLREEEIGTLRDARVMDGNDRDGLLFSHRRTGKDQLGWLIPNHAIRRAAWAEASTLADTRCITGVCTDNVHVTADGASVTLDDGTTLDAGMVVAADSRFSQTRRALGIPAHMHDFGKTMLVLRMRHEGGHDNTAWEWFAYGQTLALLPLHDAHVSSVVLTLPPRQMQAFLALDDAALGAAMAERFQHRLGTMEVAGPRCSYPLVGTWARRFVGPRCALIGDAAVGMHPVTAHGFNFGMLGQATLAGEMRHALEQGRPAWSERSLARYQRRHRMATAPLYAATQVLAGLYTDDRRPARVLRKAALHAGKHLRPFNQLITSGLTAEHGPLPPPLRRLWARRPV